MHINYYSTNLMSSLGSPGQSEAERRSVLLSLSVSVVFTGVGWASAGRLGTQSCCTMRRLSESVPQPVRHTLWMSRSSLGSVGEQGVGTAEVLGLCNNGGGQQKAAPLWNQKELQTPEIWRTGSPVPTLAPMG